LALSTVPSAKRGQPWPHPLISGSSQHRRLVRHDSGGRYRRGSRPEALPRSNRKPSPEVHWFRVCLLVIELPALLTKPGQAHSHVRKGEAQCLHRVESDYCGGFSTNPSQFDCASPIDLVWVRAGAVNSNSYAVTHAARIPGEQLSLYDAVFYCHLCQKCRRSQIEPPPASRAGSSKPW
jgi:hypothetical protein